MLPEMVFLISLLLTLIIEIPILFIFIKYIFKKNKIALKKIIIAGVIASALTLPYLWFIMPPFIKSNYLLIGESLVIIAETLIYFYLLDLDLKRSFIISLFANVASFLIGLWLL